MKVSIILPTYNRAYCIGNTIDSVLKQTYTEWELIICDDCSKDNTQELIGGYKDERIRYVRNNKNLGLPANRNIGIESSKCDMVMFLEDDIIIEPDCLEILIKTYLLLSGKVGAVTPRTIEDDKQGTLLSLEKMVADDVRRKLNKPSYISKWTGLIYRNMAMVSDKVLETDIVSSWSLFDKKAILEIGRYSTIYNKIVGYSHEETDLFVRLRKHGYKLYYQSKALAYHKHSSKGGTRVGQIRYAWNYVAAHTIFLLKNYGIKAIYMLTFSYISLILNVMKYVPKLRKND